MSYDKTLSLSLQKEIEKLMKGKGAESGEGRVILDYGNYLTSDPRSLTITFESRKP
jgi:hypothetical protein